MVINYINKIELKENKTQEILAADVLNESSYVAQAIADETPKLKDENCLSKVSFLDNKWKEVKFSFVLLIKNLVFLFSSTFIL